VQQTIQIAESRPTKLAMPLYELYRCCFKIKVTCPIKAQPMLVKILLVLCRVVRNLHMANSICDILALYTKMGRNLYILAGTLLLCAIVAFGASYTNLAQQPGSPGDVSLWRTMGLGLFVVSMVVALAAILTSLFEQAERRADDERRKRRNR